MRMCMYVYMWIVTVTRFDVLSQEFSQFSPTIFETRREEMKDAIPRIMNMRGTIEEIQELTEYVESETFTGIYPYDLSSNCVG
jgi:hypothetical protein